jgi:L-asparaginase
MRVDPVSGAASPSMSAADIVAQVPTLGDVAEFEIEEFSRLPGPHVTPEKMWQLACRAAAWIERPDIDGIVITHGTDTIEETAFLLDQCSSPNPSCWSAPCAPCRTQLGRPGNLIAAVRVAATKPLAVSASLSSWTTMSSRSRGA